MKQLDERCPPLVPIVRKALSRDPAVRYRAASQMGADLRAVRLSSPHAPPLARWLDAWMESPRSVREMPRYTPPNLAELGLGGPPPSTPSGRENPPASVTQLRIETLPEANILVLDSPEAERADGAPGFRAEMITIDAGDLWMGSPDGEIGRYADEAMHWVRVTRPCLLGVTAVTQAQWSQVMGSNPSRILNPDQPVDMVSWYDALAFCNRASELAGLSPAYRLAGLDASWDREADGFRLPTEAEWELAARAGETTRYAGSDRLDEVAWYWHTAGGNSRAVASLQPNAHGLHDMSGNVWEWVWDRHRPYAASSAEAGPDPGGRRVARGGSWFSLERDLRVACRRGGGTPGERSPFRGFRIARNGS